MEKTAAQKRAQSAALKSMIGVGIIATLPKGDAKLPKGDCKTSQ